MKRSHIPLFLALLLAQSTHLSAADPAWWAARGVTTAASPSNKSPATIGQAKWMVSQALAELQDKLSGPDFVALKASVQAVMPLATPQTPAAAEKLRGVLRVGQLKAIAQPFYDRLRLTDATWLDAQMTAAGIRILIAGSSPVRFHPYPWTTVTTAANSAPANLGQLKAVFALTFPDWTPTNADTDQDGLSDNWEWLYFGGLSQIGLSDTDGDGYSNAQEFAMASNPSLIEKDINSNGLPDAWEAANAGKFSAFPPFTAASLTRDQTLPAPIILKNDTAATVNYTISNTGNTGPAYTYEVGNLYGSTGLGWENISTSGTLLTEISDADDASQVVSFSGFTFPFYGKNYSEVYVSSNGILTFNAGCSSGAIQLIPGESAPPALIAPYWANLNPGYGGDIYFKQRGDQLIIQFDNVRNTASFNTNTFQVILNSNGEIRFNYLYMDELASYLGVGGIQDSAKVLGLQILPRQLLNRPQTTVLIKPRSEFRTLSVPSVQSIPPRTTVAIAGSLRSLTLPGAVYQTDTQISQVGNSLPPQTLTARLTVVDPPTAVALTAPTAGGTMVSGNFLDLTAQATDADGVAKVLFYDGDTLLGDDREPPYNCRAAIRSDGTRAFTAIAIDKYGTRTTSSPIPYTVLADFDGDGIPNAWELATGFDPQINDSDQDPDHDGYTNLEEYINGTNPRVAGPIVDADNDGMSDRWEIRNGLNPNVNDSALNPDGDLRADGTPFTNLMEFQADTDPKRTDTDSDGIPDGWEVSYSLKPRQNDAIGDPDSDNYTNLEEYQNGTSPRIYNNRPDLDNDGMPDAWEVSNGLNPAINDSALDPDADGLTNIQEFRQRTDPHNFDTDGDLLSDGWEVSNHLQPLLLDLLGKDSDQDGLTDLEEQSYGTDPLDPDTDKDGTQDGPEVRNGSNPKNAADQGAPPSDEEKVSVEFALGAGYYEGDREVDEDGKNSFQSYQMKISEILPSGAKTLRFTHTSNGNSSMASKKTYTLSKKNSYSIEIIPQQPGATKEKDYDYHASVKLPENSNFIISDPYPEGEGVLGAHEQDEVVGRPFPQKGKSAYLLSFELKQENMPNVGVADSSTDLASPYGIATIDSGGTSFITGQPEIPKLKASFPGLTTNINIEWKLEIKTERTERGTKDDKNFPATGYKTLPGNQAWDIGTEFGTDFVGGKCKLFYKVSGGAEQTVEFFIRGKNPKDNDAKAYVNSHTKAATYPYAWALVQHESRQGNRCYNQFNSGGDGPGNLGMPNLGPPDGWGIAQLDKPRGVSASTNEVYEWKKNVEKFYLELDEKEGVTARFFNAVAQAYPNDPDAANPPASYTVTGTNTAYSAKQLSTMILYNGAGGTQASTLNGSTYRNPWKFNFSGNPKWTFQDNQEDYAFDVIHGEVDGAFQITE